MEDMLNFGSYPRREIADTSVLGPLARLMGGRSLKSLSDINDICLCDFEYEGERYRTVIYDDGSFRCFRFEPIVWQVLEEDKDRLLLCTAEVVDVSLWGKDISHKHITADGDYYFIGQPSRKANVFYGSYFDIWLNTSFAGTAFSDKEAARIIPFEIPEKYNGVYTEPYKQFENGFIPRLRPMSDKEHTRFAQGDKAVTEYAASFDSVKAKVKNPSAGKSRRLTAEYNYVNRCRSGEYWLLDARDDYSVQAYDGIDTEVYRIGEKPPYGTAAADRLCGVVPLLQIKK